MPGTSRSSRSKGKPLAILKINASVALLDLGSDAVIDVAAFGIEKPFRLAKIRLFASVESMDLVDLCDLYLCNGDLSVAQITANIALDGVPVNPNDRVNQEQASRAIFPIMRIGPVEAEGGTGVPRQHLPYDFVLPWTFTQPDGFKLVAVNPGSAAYAAGSTIVVKATLFGVWL